MTTEALILYSVDAGVATIRFNRPEKMNALTPAMLGLFQRTVARAAADPEARVIVITGAGRAFCAGLDLAVIGNAAASGDGGASPDATGPDPAEAQWGDDIGPSLAPYYDGGWNELILARKPTIAAINGPAFGWGFILALHCDIRFAAQSAVMNATFARLGVPAEKGSGWLLTRLIGSARAMDLLYTARRIDGFDAEKLGIVNAVLPDAALADHALDYARNIARNAAPRALAAMKAQVWSALDQPYNAAFAEADREQDLCTRTEDFREGVSSYVQKRPPNFTGS